MSAPFFRPERAPLRLAALLGAAALGAGAFALPAQAQPAEPEIAFDHPEVLEAGAGFSPATLDIEFGDDFEPDAHKVTAVLEWENQEEMHYGGVSTDDGFCGMDATYNTLSCIAHDADGSLHFELEYGALDAAQAGEWGYTLTVMVDDESVAVQEGVTEIVVPDHDGQYLHGGVDFDGVAPGDTAAVKPDVYQLDALPEDTAAVVVTLAGAEYLPHNLAFAQAVFDNCTELEYGDVACLVTDFEDAPGTGFTLSEPVPYLVNQNAPGPIEVCGCYYTVAAIDAETFESEYGGVFWDEGSDNLLGLVSTGATGEFGQPYAGAITISSTPNAYDLAVGDENIKGANGDEVDVTVKIENSESTWAPSFFDGPGSYALVGHLPKGTELVSVDDTDSYYCEDDADQYFRETTPAIEDVEGADFICIFAEFPALSETELDLTVEITDAKADAKGSLQLVAFGDTEYPGALDGDLSNNTADLTLNADGSGSGKLPKTGSSMTWILAGAAAALVLGVVLFVLTRRRKATAAE
ncbi:LPXTG cell wall anchor domain-containing protein [Glycomyces terrestris]|uniref:LPXTG cell wall anchor domain-containing protein n=1 Tax=Glycomyces terrestris TaxID=2493553 RepID=A0A426US78_9ACTN|nr:LPXTG cell wall anchor domain-containing protein [Glycomyces terrestris]RRR96410.1 LPXTG cell wall anchor domain-containing protein [Glycomyces terrestris]